ncbi:MAG: SH3 domain-containing protein, partial [Clostridia bacterium]|nr:SH3 domain-containing protein [Clostridia bacterium]
MKRTAWILGCLLVMATLLLAACNNSETTDTEPSATLADTQAPAGSGEDATEPATSPDETATEPADTTAAPEETTVFELPVVDPDEAAAAGLPTDAQSYTVGGENPANDPKAQYDYLTVYAHAYADKTFTVYGNVGEDDHGNITLSVGEGMTFVVYFDGIAEPIVGSYVKVDATFTQTVDRGEYVDFGCFTMMATACETLGEAKGPNGGKLMYVTASSLNVRSEPDSSKENKVGLLYSGDMVEVLETGFGSNGNWCKITFDCDAGYAYISMSYVSETKP